MALISKKARYALHGLGFIARHSDGSPVPFHWILEYLKAYSKHLTLSPGYIAKVFQEVSRAGLTEAVSGPRGGYRLARPPENIRLIEIIEAVDGPQLSACCLLSMGDCDQQGECGVGAVVREAEQVFYEFFRTETVATLARKMTFPDLPQLTGLKRP
jgi:Rrf2 family protein